MIDTKLKGKVAIITGANNPYGIGAGIAKALASEQVKVFLQYFRVNVDNNKQLKEPDAPGEEFYNFQRQKDTYEILMLLSRSGGKLMNMNVIYLNSKLLETYLMKLKLFLAPLIYL